MITPKEFSRMIPGCTIKRVGTEDYSDVVAVGPAYTMMDDQFNDAPPYDVYSKDYGDFERIAITADLMVKVGAKRSINDEFMFTPGWTVDLADEKFAIVDPYGNQMKEVVYMDEIQCLLFFYANYRLIINA